MQICESNRDFRDFTRAEIRRALREVASCFSIYRTYVIPSRKEINDEDCSIISKACVCAKDMRQDIDGKLFDFMADVLQMKVPGEKEFEFILRFQQFTSPVMAKGVEDTAFYCYNRLTAMNEVGGNPACSGFSLAEFHNYNQHMQQTFPTTMTTLSTHDTKRADDVRARMLVLSEIPDRFAEKLNGWHESTAKYRGASVDKGTEWFLFQTMIGAWPLTLDRLKQYMQKAMREAKLQTSWVNNNAEYESALNAYMEALLSDEAFLADFTGFIAEIEQAGYLNSLTQTPPGVPDLYQGGELWDFSLVDPDNRRPVDYALRSQLLDELKTLDPAAITARMADGLPKLWLVHRALNLRTERPHSFTAEAAYRALESSGPDAERVIAYLRGDDVLTIAPRWMQSGTLPQATVQLPAGSWRNHLTGERLQAGEHPISTLLQSFPVALLVRSAEA